MIAHLEAEQKKRPDTYAIKMSPDGLSDREIEEVASRFAEYEYNTRVRDTLGRRLMSVFGLFYKSKQK